MYIWNIKALKQELVNNSLSESDIFKYAFVYLLATTLYLEALCYLPIENINQWDYLMSACFIVIGIGGFIAAYLANGGKEGKNFLNHYISISFVTGVRFTVYLIPILFALAGYFMANYSEDEEIPTQGIEVAIFSIWYFLIYWQICKHIKDVRNAV